MVFLRKYVLVFLAILLVAIGILGYFYKTTLDTLEATETDFFNTKTELEGEIAILEDKVAQEIDEKIALEQELRGEKRRNDEFESQISEIAGTVGVLEKLSQTDEELLQKYSKVYFLNEHYVPSQLSQIEAKYTYDESQDYYLHSRVVTYLRDMIEDAADDNVTLYIRSAYRSFGTQSELKSSYKVMYGSGANTFSADQGYSEHQLGTTVDFTTTGIGGGLTGFEQTNAYAWLLKNAHKYGFTLSYPEDNSYYVYEPWHWRYVGVDLATRLYREGKHFYDLDQRTIDEYLISIFD